MRSGVFRSKHGIYLIFSDYSVAFNQRKSNNWRRTLDIRKDRVESWDKSPPVLPIPFVTGLSENSFRKTDV